jgi:hypothetical protein
MEFSMDSSTIKPPFSDPSRNPTKPSSNNRPETSNLRPESSGYQLGASEKSEKLEDPRKKESLLGADGEAIPVTEGFAESAAARGREIGRKAEDSWKRISTAAQGLAEENPTRTALSALGVGILVGAVIGALLARD